MNLEEEFPHIVFLNLGKRGDRRIALEDEFERHSIDAERIAAINQRSVKDSRGFEKRSRYACCLTKRIAIRKAIQNDWPSILILEDDVVFHPELRERLSVIRMPPDWGLFYFGCFHLEPPDLIGPGIVRAVKCVDNHAMGVKKEWFRHVLRALRPCPRNRPKKLPNSDVIIAGLQSVIPSYAAYPNLAWQRCGFSDNLGGMSANYTVQGNQILRSVLKEVDRRIEILGYPESPDCSEELLAPWRDWRLW